nr:hypothetical protein [uncultured Duncaniella sp.]
MTDNLDLIKSGLGGVTLTVTADDLANLVAKSIEVAKAELLPILASQTEEALLTREEVRENSEYAMEHYGTGRRRKSLYQSRLDAKCVTGSAMWPASSPSAASKGNIDTSFPNISNCSKLFYAFKLPLYN